MSLNGRNFMKFNDKTMIIIFIRIYRLKSIAEILSGLVNEKSQHSCLRCTRLIDNEHFDLERTFLSRTTTQPGGHSQF